MSSRKPTKAERARSLAAKRGWETRRAREAQKERKAKRAKARKRVAAILGWKTRRAKEAQKEREAKRAKVAKRATKKRPTRRQLEEQNLKLRQRVYRQSRLIAAPDLHGRFKHDHRFLTVMIQTKNKKWTQFRRLGENLGFSEREIRNEWFSPKGMMFLTK